MNFRDIIFLFGVLVSCQSIPETSEPFIFTQYIRNDRLHECYVRKMEYSKSKTGPITKTFLAPFEECDDIIGEKPKEYTRKATYLEAIRLQITKP